MTPIAPHITAFLRERLPIEREASEHTCNSYALRSSCCLTSQAAF
jgi:integrase/recombinase XerD